MPVVVSSLAVQLLSEILGLLQSQQFDSFAPQAASAVVEKTQNAVVKAKIREIP